MIRSSVIMMVCLLWQTAFAASPPPTVPVADGQVGWAMAIAGMHPGHPTTHLSLAAGQINVRADGTVLLDGQVTVTGGGPLDEIWALRLVFKPTSSPARPRVTTPLQTPERVATWQSVRLIEGALTRRGAIIALQAHPHSSVSLGAAAHGVTTDRGLAGPLRWQRFDEGDSALDGRAGDLNLAIVLDAPSVAWSLLGGEPLPGGGAGGAGGQGGVGGQPDADAAVGIGGEDGAIPPDPDAAIGFGGADGALPPDPDAAIGAGGADGGAHHDGGPDAGVPVADVGIIGMGGAPGAGGAGPGGAGGAGPGGAGGGGAGGQDGGGGQGGVDPDMHVAIDLDGGQGGADPDMARPADLGGGQGGADPDMARPADLGGGQGGADPDMHVAMDLGGGQGGGGPGGQGGGGGQGGAQPDMRVVDLDAMVVPDAHSPDVRVPDGHVPDLSLPDVHVPDGHVPDVRVVDAVVVPDALGAGGGGGQGGAEPDMRAVVDMILIDDAAVDADIDAARDAHIDAALDADVDAQLDAALDAGADMDAAADMYAADVYVGDAIADVYVPDPDVYVPDPDMMTPDMMVADMGPDACQADGCVCLAIPNTTVSGEFAIPKEKFNKKIRLPFINKKVGVGLQAKFKGSGQLGTCRNGCKSTFSVSASGSADAAFGIIEVNATITGTGMYERERCKVCDDVTCRESCQELKCTTKSGSIQATAKVTRTFGLPTSEWSKGPFGIKIGCNAKASVTVGAGGGGSIKTPGPGGEDCEACDECNDVNVNASLGVDGTGGCGLDFTAWRYSRHIGCFGCLRAGASVKGKLQRKFGAGCSPAKTCVNIRGDATANADLLKCLSFRWFNVKVGCTFGVKGFAEYDSCMRPARPYGGDLTFTCSAAATRPGNCSTRCCRTCGRGKACGDSCIARWKTCRKPRGCACNNQ